MYSFSDIQTLDNSKYHSQQRKNVNMFCDKKINEQILNLKNSLEKNKLFLKNYEKITPRNNRSRNNMKLPTIQLNSTNETNNKRLSQVLSSNDIKISDKKTLDQYKLISQKNLDNLMNTKSSNDNGNSLAVNESLFRLLNSNLHRNSLSMNQLSIMGTVMESGERSPFPDDESYPDMNNKNKIKSQNKFWDGKEVNKKENKVFLNQVFDKQLVDHLKLGFKDSNKNGNEKNIRKKANENEGRFGYIKEKIMNIKKDILIMKGVFDFAYPKIIIDRLKGTKGKFDPKMKNEGLIKENLHRRTNSELKLNVVEYNFETMKKHNQIKKERKIGKYSLPKIKIKNESLKFLSKSIESQSNRSLK